ncbi:MAG: hypothetical protein MUD00_01065 [Candidatus Pacebacteria bacterium]|jgi:hypothetical protein|nr:hypothetical protein [Candidatus Paceibacterota bacterium]
MSFLYHYIPKKVEGTILYPLNLLKEKYPELSVMYVKKYVGREEIMEQRLLILDCLWNDVLHFTAVHPKDLKQALVEAGQPETFMMSFYQIDPMVLDPKNTIIYLNTQTRKEDSMLEQNFVSYTPKELAQYSFLPERTKAYYVYMYQHEHALPLMYKWVPHILYKGTLDISNAVVVTV